MVAADRRWEWLKTSMRARPAYTLAGYNPTADEVITAFKLYVQEEAKKYEPEFPNELYAEVVSALQHTDPRSRQAVAFHHPARC
jgi:hypothetical protein